MFIILVAWSGSEGEQKGRGQHVTITWNRMVNEPETRIEQRGVQGGNKGERVRKGLWESITSKESSVVT